MALAQVVVERQARRACGCSVVRCARALRSRRCDGAHLDAADADVHRRGGHHCWRLMVHGRSSAGTRQLHRRARGRRRGGPGQSSAGCRNDARRGGCGRRPWRVLWVGRAARRGRRRRVCRWPHGPCSGQCRGQCRGRPCGRDRRGFAQRGCRRGHALAQRYECIAAGARCGRRVPQRWLRGRRHQRCALRSVVITWGSSVWLDTCGRAALLRWVEQRLPLGVCRPCRAICVAAGWLRSGSGRALVRVAHVNLSRCRPGAWRGGLEQRPRAPLKHRRAALRAVYQPGEERVHAPTMSR